MDCRFAVLVLALCFSAALAESSRKLFMNDDNQLHLRLFGINASCVVTIRLLLEDNDTVLANETVKVSPEGAFSAKLSLFVPYIDMPDVRVNREPNARISINGLCDTDDSYTFNGTDECYLYPMDQRIILLQTDKPFYKLGQTMRIRAMLLDENWRSLQENNNANIWIGDTNGDRMAHWRNVSLNTIRQFEMLLSKNSVLGKWEIHCSVGSLEVSVHVDVEKIADAKFSVTIKPPSLVLVDDAYIPIEICARHILHEKDVEGELHLNVSLETETWYANKFPVVQYEGKIKGCLNYVINVSKIEENSCNHARKIKCVAVVTDSKSSFSRQKTMIITQKLCPLILNFNLKKQNNFKPGLPYNGELFVTYPNGTSVVNESIEICASVIRQRNIIGILTIRNRKYCRNFTTNHDGFFKFAIPPQNTEAVHMNLEAKSLRFANPVSRTPNRPSIQQPRVSSNLLPYFSPSGSFMQLQVHHDEIPCDSIQNIELLFTVKDLGAYQFFYEAISKGKVMLVDSVKLNYSESDDVSSSCVDPNHLVSAVNEEIDEWEGHPLANKTHYDPPIGRVTIPINVTADLSGSFYLLVYYLRSNGEVVADSQKFLVEKCFKNKVTMEFKHTLTLPQTTTSVYVHAAPNSLCVLNTVDQKLLLQDDSNQITAQKIFQAREKHEPEQDHSGRNYCNEKVRQPGRVPEDPLQPQSDSYHVDSITPFEKFGFLVISDLTLVTRPCSPEANHSTFANKIHSCNETPDHVKNSEFVEGRCLPPPSRKHSLSQESEAPSRKALKIKAQKGYNDKGPDDKVRPYFSTEDWLFDLQNTDSMGDLLKNVTLPKTVGEWVGSAVCLSKEAGLGISPQTTIQAFRDYEIHAVMPHSMVLGEVLQFTVYVANFYKVALALNVTYEMSKEFEILEDKLTNDHCIPGSTNVTLTATLRSVKVGYFNITVGARSAKSTGTCGDQKVAQTPVESFFTNIVLVEPEGYPQKRVYNTSLSQKGNDSFFVSSLDLTRPKDFVENSEDVMISVIGDPMGLPFQDPKKMLHIPTGCGEQNMAKLFPNVLALEYLNLIGRINDDIRNIIQHNLEKGVSSQLMCRHQDGSFSAFGTNDYLSSTFFTALCVRIFAKLIKLDQNYVDKSIEWLLSTQDQDGCFAEKGKTLDRYLKIMSTQVISKGDALTPFVLSSILLAGHKDETMVVKAIRCMDMRNSSSVYVNALKMYAFALTSSRFKNSTYNNLYQKQLDWMYAHAVKDDDNVLFMEKTSSGLETTQTAAYVVLAQLEAGASKEKVQPVYSYLFKKKNLLEGFTSTMDNIVGPQAMLAYTKAFGNVKMKDDLTVINVTKDVNLYFHASGKQKNPIVSDYNDDNKLAMYQFLLTNETLQLTINGTVDKTVVIQMVSRYNTFKPRNRAFTITADYACMGNCSDYGCMGDCDRGVLTICVRYLPKTGSSKMCTVEAKMVSGMTANEESLNKLLSNKELTVKHYEINDNNVVIYFHSFTNNTKCFSFELQRKFHVMNCKEAPVTVSGYYTKKNRASTHYIVDDCFRNDYIED